MQTILIATNNAKKLVELQLLLGAQTASCRFLTMRDLLRSLPDVEEDGETFEANARKKACVLAAESGYLTLADDSGLVVPALGGAPGVRSARFAGEPCDDAQNNALLLGEMQGKTDRRAAFHCVIALAEPSGSCQTVSGVCHGMLLDGLRDGGSGFGYDPLFVPAGYTQTFAEMGMEQKQRISHRARALAAAKRKWLCDGTFRLA